MKQYIITIPVNSRSDGRRVLEDICCRTFENRAELESVLCFNTYDPMATEDLFIYTVEEWVEACNETDTDFPDINLMEVWLGTVFLTER